jgi:hypothetical protein
MKDKRFALLLSAFLLAAPASAQETLDWQAIESILPGTLAFIGTAQQRVLCTIQKVTDQQLFCRSSSDDSRHPNPAHDLVLDRADIQYVHTGDRLKGDLEDDSKGSLVLLGAFGGGTALDPAHQPSFFGGVKAGIFGTSLDLQYDLLKGKNGFSVEGSGVLPLFRIPRFDPLRERKFLKVYAEPGMGYRAGGGLTGEYASAKVLLILLDDHWYDKARPYIEVQHRFPLGSPLDGDTRIAFGLMLAYCWHCGVE